MSEFGIATFGKRGLSFKLPDDGDEFPNLQQHIDVLVQAAHGMSQVLAEFDTDDNTGILEERRAANVGVAFIAAMAHELTKLLRQHEAENA